jgi:hypothetical protein
MRQAADEVGQFPWPLEWDLVTARQPCQLDLRVALLEAGGGMLDGQQATQGVADQQRMLPG